MTRTPIKITRLITEGTSYLTMRLHRQYQSLPHAIVLLKRPKNWANLKLDKLDKEVTATGRTFPDPKS